MSVLKSFFSVKGGQTDESIWIIEKLIKSAKIETFKCDILDDFRKMWVAFDLLFLGIFHVLELNSVWKLPFQKVSFYKLIFWREISNVGRGEAHQYIILITVKLFTWFFVCTFAKLLIALD